MACISHAASPSSNLRLRSSDSRAPASLPSAVNFQRSSSSLRSLSLFENREVRSRFSIRCSQSNGNGAQIKKTTLHDLYEQQGQSPWYDNLCRPVTDLKPLISNGVRGVTSNPTVLWRDFPHSASAWFISPKQSVSKEEKWFGHH